MARKPSKVVEGEQSPETIITTDHLDIEPESNFILVQCAARVGARVWLHGGGYLLSGDRIRMHKDQAEPLLLAGAVVPV